MSRHWKPEAEAARVPARLRSWPEGATAGLLLVAAACVGVALTVYEVAAPRDVFEEEPVRK